MKIYVAQECWPHEAPYILFTSTDKKKAMYKLKRLPLLGYGYNLFIDEFEEGKTGMGERILTINGKSKESQIDW